MITLCTLCGEIQKLYVHSLTGLIKHLLGTRKYPIKTESKLDKLYFRGLIHWGGGGYRLHIKIIFSIFYKALEFQGWRVRLTLIWVRKEA